VWYRETTIFNPCGKCSVFQLTAIREPLVSGAYVLLVFIYNFPASYSSSRKIVYRNWSDSLKVKANIKSQSTTKQSIYSEITAIVLFISYLTIQEIQQKNNSYTSSNFNCHFGWRKCKFNRVTIAALHLTNLLLAWSFVSSQGLVFIPPLSK